MIVLPEFIFKDIVDPWVRENFKRLNSFFLKDALLKGLWQFREIEFLAAQTNAKIPHGLSFRPTDLILTSKTGPGDATINYDLFDNTNLDITTTDACVIRCFIGSYKEESAGRSR